MTRSLFLNSVSEYTRYALYSRSLNESEAAWRAAFDRLGENYAGRYPEPVTTAAGRVGA